MSVRLTWLPYLFLCAALIFLNGCGKDEPAETDANAAAENLPGSATGELETASADAVENADKALSDAADEPESGAALPEVPTVSAGATSPDADQGARLPYPAYPNGHQYRVGNENGLRIVLVETSDEFAAVDTFYREFATSGEMNRLEGMDDYVRYSTQTDDDDPWATFQPGIVIHQFNAPEEALAVGASPGSRTNIIYSY